MQKIKMKILEYKKTSYLKTNQQSGYCADVFIGEPNINKKLLVEENINFVIQINGKKRGLIKANRNISENEILRLIKENTEINKYIKNQELKKKIFVPNKLINIIV